MNEPSLNKINLKSNRFLKVLRPVLGAVIIIFILYRLNQVLLVQREYGPETWMRLLIAGLVIGGVYALIAIGYTLVYGILFMINFAHGEVMMLGAYSCFFVFEAFKAIHVPSGESFANAYPAVAILIGFIVGMGVSATMGFLLEKIVYRPLCKAPRLVPLIGAIGASIFLQNAAQLLWTSNPKVFTSVVGNGAVKLFGGKLAISHVTIVTIVSCIIIMCALTFFTGKTKMGKAMRACSEDKAAAQLMGINVNTTISMTFAIGSALAAIAGVLRCLQ